MTDILCDQCHSFPATDIDLDAQTWCAKCRDYAFAHATEHSALAPCVFSIPFIRIALTDLRCRIFMLHIPPERRERWAQRLGLPPPEPQTDR